MLTHTRPSAVVTRAALPSLPPSIYASPALVAQPLSEQCLHHLFEAQAAQTPTAIAVVHSDQTLTYETLNQRANQLAHALIDLGIGPESLVAISLERSAEMMIAFLAVLKAGGAYVPIDPAYPEVRRHYILADAEATVILTQSALAAEFADSEATVICLDTNWPAHQPQTNPQVSVSLDNLAYVIYTSGSTGNPKGVMAIHRGVANYSLVMAEALGLMSCDRMLQFSTMSFDFIVSEIYPTLVAGGAVILRPAAISTSINAFLDFITAQEVTVMQFTTAFWHELVGGLERLQAKLPPSLRIVLFGGEKASVAVCRQWFNLVGNYPRLFNAYGPTETTVITTIYDVLAEGYDCSYDLPIGRPLRNLETYIFNEDLQPVAAGEPGELYIGGPGVTRGYLNLPEKTANAFIPHPWAASERLYRTGDIVRQAESGPIEFVGRVDFQVKIRGFRIELGEIESCLDQHSQIQQRIVLAREDVPGDKRLVAYLVVKPGQTLDIKELQQFLRERLPHFMVPTAFVCLEKLPQNSNGKIDRKALPAPTANDRQQALVPPRTALEKQLVELWQTILDIQPIGITDDFFELGGHSLLVMRLFSQLEVTFDRSLPLIDIFSAPTIEQLASRLEQAYEVRIQGTLTKLRAGTLEPPLFLVHDFDGDTGLYINLARQLGGLEETGTAHNHPASRAVYGIKPLSSPGIPMVHSRIVEMANHCVEQMRAIQPQGPYLLGGLCAGGIIAFETALQLEQAGEQVALLALMDAPDAAAKQRVGLLAEQRKARLSQALQAEASWRQRWQKVWQKGRNLVSYELSARYQQVEICAKAHAFRWCQDRGWPLPDVLGDLSVRALILFAYQHYLPKGQLRAKTILFRATQGDGSLVDTPYHELYQDPLLGWGCRCQHPVQAFDMPGGHSTMLSAVNAQAMAEVLQGAIDEALAAPVV